MVLASTEYTATLVTPVNWNCPRDELYETYGERDPPIHEGEGGGTMKNVWTPAEVKVCVELPFIKR
jgi:hypothetical protein